MVFHIAVYADGAGRLRMAQRVGGQATDVALAQCAGEGQEAAARPLRFRALEPEARSIEQPVVHAPRHPADERARRSEAHRPVGQAYEREPLEDAVVPRDLLGPLAGRPQRGAQLVARGTRQRDHLRLALRQRTAGQESGLEVDGPLRRRDVVRRRLADRSACHTGTEAAPPGRGRRPRAGARRPPSERDGG